ncbi:DUF3857 domain-containing transglutaminase family protein [Sphingobacterium sp. SRCM116780]|uniref:DUF3857 domain-containing protein n=1 Tax=Sphingobacterium sp. SRCM116780 TaxID=2907623 RepID=UPI001F2E65F4|nr:DUF3857 domain-containing transglutaminase family protein [Sphingobacterium sp. SRCM116780]UIR56681.1 DUF3857 domain-containing transglutaminase family protein [Sphingobacterium sp. SRCM116780]
MRIYLFLLTIISTQVTIAQTNYAVENIPSKLKTRAAATIREEKLSLEILPNNQVVEILNKAITVYNKNGDIYANLPIYYNKNTSIKELKGTVYNEFGLATRKITAKDFNDKSAVDNGTLYADVRVKFYTPQQTEYPYTIEYKYEIRHKQNLALPVWDPSYNENVSVEKSSFELITPKQTQVRINSLNYNNTIEKTETDKGIIQTWKVENLAAQRLESYSPNPLKYAPRVQVVPEKFVYYDKEGSFKDWKEFGLWMNTSLLSGKQNLSPSVKTEVINLTKNVTSPKEKAKLIYEYMQNKTRYISVQIGIGGLEPFPASEVDRLGYGDCKALANYMQNLLSFADIPSYYCIVEAGSMKRDINATFANVLDGNHIILCLPFANDTTWLECTSQTLPFGFLDDFTDDRLVLACTPDGGKILKTPKYTVEDNNQIREAHLKLDDNGNLTGNVSTTFSGTTYSNHYDVILASTPEKPKLLANYYNIDNINFDKIQYTENKSAKPSINEKIDVFIKNYAVKSDGKIIIHPNIFNIRSTLSAIKNRQKEVYINRAFTEIDRIIIDLPQSIKLTIPIEKQVFSCIMGKYEVTNEIKDGKLYFNRKLVINDGTYPAESFIDFVEFHTNINSADRSKFTLPIQ